MNEQISKIFNERLAKLPEKAAKVIINFQWLKEIQSIARNNKLNKDKTESFILETVLIVLGLESPKNYPNNLSEKVGFDDNLVVKIAKEVDEKIISPILKKISEESDKKWQQQKNTLTTESQKRIDDISKKYALNDEQKNNLSIIASAVLENLENKNGLADILVKNLGISSILAEQIINDLESRVFGVAIKKVVSEKELKSQQPILARTVLDTRGPQTLPKVNLPKMSKVPFDSVKPNQSTPSPVLDTKVPPAPPKSVTAMVPEIKPGLVPEILPGETVHINKPPQNAPAPAPSAPKINYKPIPETRPETAPKPEVIQTPVAVPRIDLNKEVDGNKSPVDKEEKNEEIVKPAGNFMDNKLRNVTTGIPEEKTPNPVTKFDPYREPPE